MTGSHWKEDGYRDQSDGYGDRASFNFGYQPSADFETRFYVNANRVRQRIPGELDKATALSAAQTAAAINVTNDWQRNIDTFRVANKSVVRFDNTTIEFGLHGLDRHLMHPIFVWLDEKHRNFGGFIRATDERLIGGRRNRLIVGANFLNGDIDVAWNVNIGGNKGPALNSLTRKAENTSFFIENSHYFIPNVAVVAGAQFLAASREQTVNFSFVGDVNGKSTFNLWSPKVGLLWDVAPDWQAFANVSRSAEVPSFDEGGSIATPNWTTVRAQRATTYEVGTRGRRPDVTWDLAVYRANITDELQCFANTPPTGLCTVVNADKTVHQGIEAGLGLSLFKGIAVTSGEQDRIWLNVAYTYNNFFYNGDALFGNNKLPGAPDHYVRAELLYKHPAGYSFGPNVEWVPTDYYVDAANTLTTPSYAIWGLRAQYESSKFSAYIEGRNLANTAYISSVSNVDRAPAGYAGFWPGSGRGIYAGIRYKM